MKRFILLLAIMFVLIPYFSLFSKSFSFEISSEQVLPQNSSLMGYKNNYRQTPPSKDVRNPDIKQTYRSNDSEKVYRNPDLKSDYRNSDTTKVLRNPDAKNDYRNSNTTRIYRNTNGKQDYQQLDTDY